MGLQGLNMTKEEKKLYMKKYSKKYYQANKEYLKKQMKKYRIEHKEEKKKQDIEYYTLNKEALCNYKKEWYQANKKELNESRKEYQNKYRPKKYATDLNFKLICLARNNQRRALKGFIKSGYTLDLLGCTLNEWKRHLESTFTEGMSWNKVMSGEIHIDHIKPLCSFHMDDFEQQRTALHWKNTRCLWAKDNLAKIGSDRKLSIRGK